MTNAAEADTPGSRYVRDGTVVDVKLFGAIGLTQILNPAGAGGLRTAVWTGFWAVFGMVVVNVWALYRASGDFQRFTYLIMVLTYTYTCLVKAYALLTDSRRLRAVLDVARYAYTSCGRRNQSRLTRCRAYLRALLRVYVVFNLFGGFVWLLTPVFAYQRVVVVVVVGLTGTVHHYRMNIINLWVPLSEAAYNSPGGWTLVYGYESFVALFTMCVRLMFDCYLLTVCFALTAQFGTVVAGYETLGRSTPMDRARPQGDKNYRDLIRLVQDNQHVVKKHDDFFQVARTVILSQVICESITGVLAIFFTSLTIVTTGWSILIWKYIIAYAVSTTQLAMYCYAFSHVETAKSELNFGLYSSNWTEMDLKYKKTVLLAMKMNSSCHNRFPKLTPTAAINLAMFTRVLKTSYSIVSLLLNTAVEK